MTQYQKIYDPELNVLIRSILFKHASCYSDVLNSGGFIAGGAARIFANAHFFGKNSLETQFLHHIFINGDVDFFFKNEESVIKVAQTYGNFKETVTGYAYEDARTFRCRVQIIRKNFGEIEDVLNSFDFLNCAVAWDGKHLYVPDEWYEFEKTSTLKIMNIHSPFILSRVGKYLHRKNYSKLDESSASMLVAHVLNTLLPNVLSVPVDEMKFYNLQKSLASIAWHLSKIDLVVLSPLLNRHGQDFTYNYAFKEVVRRNQK